jgi:hypothetical protein
MNVFLEVEPIPFNRGFYSVDMTFYFLVRLSAYYTPVSTADTVCGVAFFSKKVILYGSEGNVKVFNSEATSGESTNSPKAVVQVVDPICLHSRMVESSDNEHVSEIHFPVRVTALFDGNFVSGNCHTVLITLACLRSSSRAPCADARSGLRLLHPGKDASPRRTIPASIQTYQIPDQRVFPAAAGGYRYEQQLQLRLWLRMQFVQ